MLSDLTLMQTIKDLCGSLDRAKSRYLGQGKKCLSRELPLRLPSELMVYPVEGKLCVLVLGHYLTRRMTADELDDLALRFHEAARETRRGVRRRSQG